MHWYCGVLSACGAAGSSKNAGCWFIQPVHDVVGSLPEWIG